MLKLISQQTKKRSTLGHSLMKHSQRCKPPYVYRSPSVQDLSTDELVV